MDYLCTRLQNLDFFKLKTFPDDKSLIAQIRNITFESLKRVNTLWEEEKMLVTFLLFPHNVFF